MSPRTHVIQLAVSALLLSTWLGACAPEIGDPCETALDCSASGTRLCDRTQPQGYCTIQGCEQGTCPEEAVCVKFQPEIDRLSTTYCMYKCDDDGDCRDDQNYACVRAEAFGARAVPPAPDADAAGGVVLPGLEAMVLGRASQKFCAYQVPVTPPMSMPMPMSTTPDAGVDDDAGALMSTD